MKNLLKRVGLFVFYGGLCGIVLRYSLFPLLTVFFLIETLFLILIKSSFSQKSLKIICIFLITCSLLQLFSIILIGRFIPPLMWSNLNQYDSMFTRSKALIIALIFVAMLIIYCQISYPKIKNRKILSTLIFLMCIGECVGHNFFPIASFFTSIKNASFSSIFSPRNHGVSTDYFYHPSLRQYTSRWNNPLTKHKNVILIFVEGMSEIVISEKVTPNIFELRNQSLSFENYYNHTAATFRGIRGQLTSGVQMRNGGGDLAKLPVEDLKKLYLTKPESLPDILGQIGYTTLFLSPHGDLESFSVFIEKIGFQKVLTFSKDPNLSDKEVYQHLFQTALSHKDTPFFIVAYFNGTHLGLYSPDLIYADGKNENLNKFYNHDHWLGVFWERFKQSPLSENTLLVFTSDHASYPSKDFIETFHSKSLHFVDRIPLFIYHKNLKPERFDANGLTSLALAPTLLDLLGYENVQNHFLGHSLFENTPHDPHEYLFIDGSSCLSISKGKLSSAELKKGCRTIFDYYSVYQ